MNRFRVDRTMLNDGVQISKYDDAGKLLAGIVLPWNVSGDIATAIMQLAVSHSLLESSQEINKHLETGHE